MMEEIAFTGEQLTSIVLDGIEDYLLIDQINKYNSVRYFFNGVEVKGDDIKIVAYNKKEEE